MGRRGYPLELRQQALAQVAAGRSVYQVAQEHGISVQVIYRWRQAAAEPPAGKPAD